MVVISKIIIRKEDLRMFTLTFTTFINVFNTDLAIKQISYYHRSNLEPRYICMYLIKKYRFTLFKCLKETHL